MKIVATLALLLVSSTTLAIEQCPDVLKHIKRKLNSQETVNLCEEYKGKAVLFVNTASKCGYTHQFEGLEQLYSARKDDGLVILGFPSNDFAQEFSDEAKTAEVCELTYGVNFPMFEPVSVRGESADPLFRQLTNKTGKTPQWNFNKFLMDKTGNVFKHYGSKVAPDNAEFLQDIELALSGEQPVSE